MPSSVPSAPQTIVVPTWVDFADLMGRVAKLEAAPPPVVPVPPVVPPSPPPTGDPLARPLFDPSRLKLVGGWRYPENVGGQIPSTAFTAKNLTARQNADGTISFWSCWGTLDEVRTVGAFGTDPDPTKWPLMQAVGAHPASESYKKVFDWDVTDDDPAPLGCLRDKAGVLISGVSGYATPVPTDPFLVRLNDNGSVDGPWGLPGGLCQVYGGGLAWLPKEISDLLGGLDMLLAAGGYHSGQGSTAGAAAMAVRSSKLAERMDPADFKELLRFGDFGTTIKAMRERRDANYSTPAWGVEPDASGGYWAQEAVLGQGHCIDSLHCQGLIFPVSVGQGPMSYANQGETFALARKIYLYAYDWNDLVAVYKGQKLPSAVRGTFTEWPALPGVTGPQTSNWNFRPEGFTQLDQKYLYVLHKWVWGGLSEYAPVVCVYEIQ